VRGFDSTELKAAIWERLGLKIDSSDDSTSPSTATPVAIATATPEASLDSATR
jgi:hypothetical protein